MSKLLDRIVDRVDTAATRIVPQSNEAVQNRDKHLYPMARGVGATALAGALLMGGLSLGDRIANPIEYSKGSTTYTAGEGDGLLTIVDSIPGSDTVDRREVADYIKHHPANSGVFENGQIDLGETLTIPTEVNPR